MTRVGRSPALGAALLALIAGGNRALGDGVVRDSIGAISSGRGGVNIAYSDNLSLINDNPAGLVRIGGLRLELGADLLKTDIEYQDPQNDTKALNEVFALPFVAVSYRVTEAPRPITVGLGFFMPAGYGAEYRLNHPVYGRQKYLSQAGLYKLMPTVSVDLGRGFSLGAGVGMAYESAEFDSPYTFQTGSFMGTPALVELEADGFGVAWNIGLQYRINDRWTVGLAYIAETQIDLEGEFDVDIPGGPFPDNTAGYDVEVENSWPRSLGLGTAYRFDCGTVSLDALWFDWSSAFDAFAFRLKHGDNPFFNAAAGTDGPTDKFPLEWHDSYTFRLGGEYFLTSADTVRAGYIFLTNPIPDRTLTPLLPATLEHSIAVGYSRLLPRAPFGQLALDLAYQFSWGEKQSVGASSIVGGDFDNSSVRAMAHWLFIGLNLTF